MSNKWYYRDKQPIVIVMIPDVGTYTSNLNHTHKSNMIVSLDSISYRWIKNINDGKIYRHIEWPINYIHDIKIITIESDGCKDYKNLKYVLIDYSDDIIKELIRENISFIIAAEKVGDNNTNGIFKSFKLRIKNQVKKCKLDNLPMIYIEENIIDLLNKKDTYNNLISMINTWNKKSNG